MKSKSILFRARAALGILLIIIMTIGCTDPQPEKITVTVLSGTKNSPVYVYHYQYRVLLKDSTVTTYFTNEVFLPGDKIKIIKPQ
jgi:hypothetical protein